jgi:hypothetical protein
VSKPSKSRLTVLIATPSALAIRSIVHWCSRQQVARQRVIKLGVRSWGCAPAAAARSGALPAERGWWETACAGFRRESASRISYTPRTNLWSENEDKNRA